MKENELPRGRALKVPSGDFPPSGGVSESVARGATRRFLRGRASGNYTHTTIKEMFAIIKDPRHESYVKYELYDILVLVMGAVICGMTEIRDMMTYFKNTRDFYKEKFNIDKIPSSSTISRTL